METAFYSGAMYVRLNKPEKLIKEPIRLGDGELYPGEYVQKLGEKKRSSFVMLKSWYLRYKGWYEDEYGSKVLFFDTNTVDDTSPYDWHYGFCYIEQHVLLICAEQSAWDIRINHLEKFERVPMHASERQLSFV